MRLYHSSNVCVEHPDTEHSRLYLDFGRGFYLTSLHEQAVKYAQRFKRRGQPAWLNTYEFTCDETLWDIKRFESYDKEWLDFVADCRRGVKHGYDIVEGPMADDQIWDYVEDFMEGTISREAFWVLAKFKYPTHQIVFCTQKALETIKYERSISL